MARHRYHERSWKTAADFWAACENFFLATEYLQQLKDDINRRRRKTGEVGKDFVIDLQFLIRRGQMTERQQLHCLYTNLLPNIGNKFDGGILRYVSTLVAEIDSHEHLQKELKQSHRIRIATFDTAISAKAPAVSYNRNNKCWRCGNEEHFRTEPNMAFCSRY